MSNETIILPEDGFLRLRKVLEIYPVSRTCWLSGIRKGIFPKGIKLSEGTVAWRVSDIKALIEKAEAGEYA
ncbi:MAG: AlpA family phage regulatory protein [Mariprofundales bacterium]